MRRLAILLAVLGAIATPARAYTDAELIRGFMLTVFGAEVIEGRDDANAAGRVKKFVGPVRYRIVSTAGVDASPIVRDYIEDLSRSVDGLRLIEVVGAARSEMVIYLVDRRDYGATILRTVWAGVDTSFLERNACSAVIAARTSGIERANVYLVADEGMLPLTHCMIEEIAQSLGPANDSDLLPESIFNDGSLINVFGEFDWFILNMLYDRRVRAGMTPEQAVVVLPDAIASARRRLPDVLRDVRAIAEARPKPALAGQ